MWPMNENGLPRNENERPLGRITAECCEPRATPAGRQERPRRFSQSRASVAPALAGSNQFSLLFVGGVLGLADELLQLANRLLRNSRDGELGILGSASDRQLGFAHCLIGVASQLVGRTASIEAIERGCYSVFHLVNCALRSFLKFESGGFDRLLCRVGQGVNSLLDLFDRLANDICDCFCTRNLLVSLGRANFCRRLERYASIIPGGEVRSAKLAYGQEVLARLTGVPGGNVFS